MITRKTYKFMTALLGIVLFSFSPAGILAQQPGITVDFVVSPYTGQGQPIMTTVVVTNSDGRDLLMNGGFSAGLSQLKIRVIDPAGRLILPAVPSPVEGKDAGPLPIINYEGREIQAADCEWLPQNAVRSSPTVDLRSLYAMPLPGYYSAQVQIDAAVFNSLPCSVNDYRWQGVLKSETKYFFYEGDTTVSLGIANWPQSWTDDSYSSDLLMVTITPTAPLDSYDLTSLRLNKVAAESVTVQSGKIMASFSKQKVYMTLNNPVAGQSYPVVISGLYTSGAIFGGTGKITVVVPYTFTGFKSPVDNPPIVNKANSGQAVPVKWQIANASGPISDPASFVSLTSYGISCENYVSNPESPVEEYARASSGLQYLGSGNWQYNWSVPRTYSGTCRKLVLILKDGTTHIANFKFK